LRRALTPRYAQVQYAQDLIEAALNRARSGR